MMAVRQSLFADSSVSQFTVRYNAIGLPKKDLAVELLVR